MTRARAVAAGLVLAGPTAVAFFTGGYPDLPRLWAGLAAWLLAGTGLVLAGPPAGRPARLAIGGLAGLSAWTLLSAAWAPVAGAAWDTAQLTVLYLGALVAAAVLLRGRVARAVEPAVAAGTLVVVGYGLSERLLPGLLSFARSASAQGRLEQPLTYWNAMGALAALGLVLCARIAGDASRSARLRPAAAAAAVPLGMGLYLTVSRGALFACGAGLLTLLVTAGRREQLRGAAVVAGAGILAAVAAAPFDGVTSLTGGSRERDGAIVLVLLLVLAAAAAAVERVLAAEERPGPLLLPRAAPLAALAVVVAGFAVAVAVGGDERTAGSLTPGAKRYATFTSNRYAYWKVAGRAFEAEPVRGVGAAGWAVWWRRERPFREGAHDAHSLYVQTAAELGLVGLALLATWLAGIGLAARDALESDAQAAAGLLSGIVVWAAHAALDWDFQMPAATLPAVVLMGALLALREPRRSAAPRG